MRGKEEARGEVEVEVEVERWRWEKDGRKN
jgi:hypothetical protein